MASQPGNSEIQLHPGQTALLVIDIQNDFCAKGGYLNRVYNHDVSFAQPIADNINALVATARAAGVAIIWIRSHYDPKYLANASITKRRDEGCCLEGTWGADFFSVRPQQGDLIITKHSFSGFHATVLHDELQQRGIKTLILTGVATNVCVDSTLREGYSNGYDIVLAEDCVDSNDKVGHLGTLSTVRTIIGSVLNSHQIAQLLKIPAIAPSM